MCHDLCHSVTVIAIRRVNHVYDFLKIRMLLNIVFNFSLLEEKIKKKNSVFYLCISLQKSMPLKLCFLFYACNTIIQSCTFIVITIWFA